MTTRVMMMIRTAMTKCRDQREKKYVEGSLQCGTMINETTFISGGDSGCVFFLLCLVDIADVFLFRSICL